MRTLLISGSDTAIGKTRVTGVLAALLPGPGETVQIVKPVETGVPAGGPGDADAAAAFARERGAAPDTHTLVRFPEPLAPVTAARAAGRALDPDGLADAVNRLPACDWRLVEGAGGLAVPLDAAGRDWTDFAASLPGAHVVLVVPDRLGAINQARLTAAYARGKGHAFSVWLNETTAETAAVREANRSGLTECGLAPVFRLRRDAGLPENSDAVAAFYRKIAESGPSSGAHNPTRFSHGSTEMPNTR